jgi:hypothetical protein
VLLSVATLLGATAAAAAAALHTVGLLRCITPADPALCGLLYDLLPHQRLVLLACNRIGPLCKAYVCIIISITLPFSSTCCGCIMAEDAGWAPESKAWRGRLVVVLVMPVLLLRLLLCMHWHLRVPETSTGGSMHCVLLLLLLLRGCLRAALAGAGCCAAGGRCRQHGTAACTANSSSACVVLFAMPAGI